MSFLGYWVLDQWVVSGRRVQKFGISTLCASPFFFLGTNCSPRIVASGSTLPPPLPPLPGVTEGFLHAMSSERQLGRNNGILLAFSAAYLALSVLLIGRGGPAGLVVANCFSIRITHLPHSTPPLASGCMHLIVQWRSPDLIIFTKIIFMYKKW